jgi:WD40 repeat protein
LDGQWGAVVNLAFAADGAALVTESSQGTTALWSLDEKEPVLTPVAVTPLPVVDLASYGDGGRIVLVDEAGTIRVRNRVSGEVIGEVLPEIPIVKFNGSRPIRTNWLALDAQGSRAATISYDESVGVADLNAGRYLPKCRIPFILEPNGDIVHLYSVALSPDGRQLATGADDGYVRVYETATAQLISSTVNKHEGKVNQVAFNVDGTRLASAAGDGTAKIWEVNAWEKPPLVLQIHGGSVARVAFDPAGKYLGTIGADKTVRLWDLSPSGKGEEFFTVSQDIGVSPSNFAFGPRSRLAIATTSLSGAQVAIYDFDEQALLQLAKERAKAEWYKEMKRLLHGLKPIEP